MQSEIITQKNIHIVILNFNNHQSHAREELRRQQQQQQV